MSLLARGATTKPAHDQSHNPSRNEGDCGNQELVTGSASDCQYPTWPLVQRLGWGRHDLLTPRGEAAGAVAEGVAFGVGVTDRVGVAVALGDGVALGVADGVVDGVTDGVGVGSGVGVTDGVGVGSGVGVGVGVALGDGVGSGGFRR